MKLKNIYELTTKYCKSLIVNIYLFNDTLLIIVLILVRYTES